MATRSTKSAPAKKSPAKAKKSRVAVSTSIPQSMSPKEKSMMKSQLVQYLKRPQIFIPLAILLAAVIVYLLRGMFVVAMVNGKFITRPAFESAMQKQDGKQILNTLVTQSLIEQEAAKKGVTVSQTDIDAQAKKIDTQLAKQGQTLDQALAARGMTRSDFNEQIRLQGLLQKLLGSTIKVSDKEVQEYIDKNKDSMPTGQSDDQLKTSVRQQLEQQKLSTAAQALVQKLQSTAKITYFLTL